MFLLMILTQDDYIRMSRDLTTIIYHLVAPLSYLNFLLKLCYPIIYNFTSFFWGWIRFGTPILFINGSQIQIQQIDFVLHPDPDPNLAYENGSGPDPPWFCPASDQPVCIPSFDACILQTNAQVILMLPSNRTPQYSIRCLREWIVPKQH